MLQINADGVSRKFHPGDKLPLWHEEMEPQNSLLDILAAGNPDPMVQWFSHTPPFFSNFLLYLTCSRFLLNWTAELFHTDLLLLFIILT